jgi:twitching motility protein PilI
MAKREALRELQSRLASRLQAARTEGVRLAWLAVAAGTGRYLIPLQQAGEIFPWEGAQAVPYTKAWFLGVAHLRGGLLGVVDLGAFLSSTGGDSGLEAARQEAYLVALNAALEVNCALRVDALLGLRSVDSFDASAPPSPAAPAYFGSVYTESNGAVWQEINLQSLSQQDDFLNIGT